MKSIKGITLNLTHAVCCSWLETACVVWTRDCNYYGWPFNNVNWLYTVHNVEKLRVGGILPVLKRVCSSWHWNISVFSTLYPWAALFTGEKPSLICVVNHFRALWLNCKECLATAITITTISLRFVCLFVLVKNNAYMHLSASCVKLNIPCFLLTGTMLKEPL